MRILNFQQASDLGNNNKFTSEKFSLVDELIFNSKKSIFFLIVINLSITVFLSAFLNIWLDEAYALNTTSKGLLYAVHQSLYFEFQPPFYFIVMSFWRDINTSIFFARFFSVICISLSIYFLPRLSTRYLPGTQPIWLAVIFALNPFTIWAAVEIRTYALIILLSILLLILFYDAYLIENSKTKYSRWIYLMVAVIGLYTQYYVGFLLVANASVLLVNKKWSVLRRYLIDMIIPAVFLGIIIPQIIWQVHLNHGFNIIRENLLQCIRFMYQRCESYLMPFNEYLRGEPKRWVFRFGLIILLYFTLKPISKVFNSGKIYIWPVVAVLFLIFAALLNYVGPDFLLPRHTAVLFVPVLLLFLSVISITKNKKYIAIWTTLILVISIVSLAFQYKTLAKPGDFIRVADYIMEHENNNQPILIFRREMALPFEYYYKGINRIVPIPKEFSFTGTYNYDKSEWPLKSEKEVANIFSSISGSPASFWLITNQDYKIYNQSVNSYYLEDYINQNFNIISYKKFYGVDLRLLRKK